MAAVNMIPMDGLDQHLLAATVPSYCSPSLRLFSLTVLSYCSCLTTRLLQAGKGGNAGPSSRRTSVESNVRPSGSKSDVDPNGSVSRRGSKQAMSTASGLLAHSAAAGTSLRTDLSLSQCLIFVTLVGDPSKSLSKSSKKKRSSSASALPASLSVMERLSSAMANVSIFCLCRILCLSCFTRGFV